MRLQAVKDAAQAIVAVIIRIRFISPKVIFRKVIKNEIDRYIEGLISFTFAQNINYGYC